LSHFTRRRTIAATAVALLLAFVPASADSAEIITVFAAASVKNGLDEAAAAFRASAGVETRISYAASFTLAKQIEAGAPADVFISADAASMDYLAERKLIDPATRVDLLGNSLVLVAPRTAPIDRLALKQEAILGALGEGRVAMGDPASVPAGKYGRAAFEKLGLWGALESRAAVADNVRNALLFVARGEAPLGVVYATDARAEPKVKVVASFPSGSHPRIVYPLAAMAKAGEPARRFVAFLGSAAAKAAFDREGFVFLPR